MNKQGNTYTFLYSVVLVIVVAALLSVISLSLQPRQNENRENEKRQNILSAIHVSSTADNSAELFGKYIKEQFIVNAKGEKVEGNAFNVNIQEQYGQPEDKRALPVFVAEVNGSTKYILPIYGAGLWGPIWGYISLDENKDTIFGTFFDHQGETPGLGAEITTPKFNGQFRNKQIFSGNTLVGIKVLKGGTASGNN
ncbi:MAG: NADH:ubiquinone reductase (Na(+)-transporting) subunit C, partial [Odoribacter sp.]|nr:NADH:ubiquinone reductase (Na(+)-transporting) subunit C [Odoribacter sp.]